MRHQLSAPYSVQIEITEKCPNSCLHCYNHWRNDNAALSSFPIKFVEKTVEQIVEIAIPRVVITGGEPLANRSVLHAFSKSLKANNITVSLNTTLIGLRDSDLPVLRSFDSVLVSVLGSTAELHDRIAQRAGAFEKTLHGLRVLHVNGIRASVNMVVSHLNVHDLDAVAALVSAEGVHTFSATRAACPANADGFEAMALDKNEYRQHLITLVRIGSRYNLRTSFLSCYPLCGMPEEALAVFGGGRPCTAGVSFAAIGVRGDVRPCPQSPEVFGSVVTGSLREAWNRMSSWAEGSYIPDQCRSCALLHRCAGGCRVDAKLRCGSINALDPYAQPERISTVKEKLFALPRKPPVAIPVFLKLNPTFRLRQEPMGFTTFLGSQAAGIITEELAVVLHNLGLVAHQSNYIGNTIARALGTDSLLTIATLVQRKILLPANEPSEGVS